ncbi:MAG: type II secretion system F family protein [Myxococcales bacterium]|nr:type II secretion system F family protein [Myxococcota bacterium]MDW8281341.1 type II secretion system F family protein [Myxococcales bacterium]
MPMFAYEAKSRDGKIQRGQIEGQNPFDATTKLRAQGLNVVSIAPKGSFDIKKILSALPLVGGSGVKEKDLVVFTRQFATMIDAGLPLVQCLEILGGQADNKKFKRVIEDIKVSVEGGSQLSDAMRKHPGVFDELYCNLVQAGEAGGILDTILNRLSVYIEKASKLKGQVKSAMSYPIGVLVVACVVVAVLLYKVIPVFEKMFKDFGGTLPAPTQFVIDLSHAFSSNFHFFLGGILLLVTGFRLFTSHPRGRYLWHKTLLKFPVIGMVLRKVAVARFTRTMSTLLASGVPILDAMEIVARTAGNAVIEEGIMYARSKVAEGKPIVEPLMETGIFPAMVVQMIGVGEQAGALDIMLGKIADFYDDEVDAAVKALTSLMEPLMMVFLGGICGGLLIAMYMPIFEMAGNIKAG